jgi:hypothetical protein
LVLRERAAFKWLAPQLLAADAEERHKLQSRLDGSQ